MDFFKKNKINCEFINKDRKFILNEIKNYDTLIYGGGGALIKYWLGEFRLKILGNSYSNKIIILPHSILYVDKLIELLQNKHVIFTRELKSYNYLKPLKNQTKNFSLFSDHDMAFRLNKIKTIQSYFNEPFQTVYNIVDKLLLYERKLICKTLYKIYNFLNNTYAKGEKISYILRTDKEKSFNQTIKKSFDLSLVGMIYENSTFEYIELLSQIIFSTLDCFDAIVTDRLHMGISASLLNKTVYLFDNSYGKISGIYQQSMKDNKNIIFCSKIPNFSKIKLKVTDKSKCIYDYYPFGDTFFNDVNQLISDKKRSKKYQISKYFKQKLQELKNITKSSKNNKKCIKISIILYIDGTEKFLNDCLNSLIHQTLKEIEIICFFNDEKNKQVLKLLQDFRKVDKRIVIIKNYEPAINYAIDNKLKFTSGEYLAFIHPNDILNQNAYEIAYFIAKKNNLDLVQFNYKEFSENVKDFFILKKLFVNFIKKNIYNSLGKMGNKMWDKLYKADIIYEHNIHFLHKLEGKDDRIFNYIFLSYCKLLKEIPINLYYHRILELNNTNNEESETEKMKTDILFLDSLKSELDKRNLSIGNTSTLITYLMKDVINENKILNNYPQIFSYILGINLPNYKKIEKHKKINYFTRKLEI